MHSSIIQTVSGESQNTDNKIIAKWGTVSAILNFLALSVKSVPEPSEQKNMATMYELVKSIDNFGSPSNPLNHH
jgi:hypothetical protein